MYDRKKKNNSEKQKDEYRRQRTTSRDDRDEIAAAKKRRTNQKNTKNQQAAHTNLQSKEYERRDRPKRDEAGSEGERKLEPRKDKREHVKEKLKKQSSGNNTTWKRESEPYVKKESRGPENTKTWMHECIDA